jgi:hypothetical protein
MAGEEDQQTRYGLARAQLTSRERQQLDKEELRAYNKAMFGTNIPDVEDKRKLEKLQTGAAIASEIEKNGGSVPMDGLNEVGQSVSTLGMTDKEKFFAQGRLKDRQQLGEFKTFGDKAAFEAKNAIRALQGLDPIAAPLPPQNQFQLDLEKSALLGAESALTGQKGQARAFEAGIRAGYSPEETRKLISDTAARITGIADQQKEQPTETPKSPAKLPLFEQVYEQFRTPVTTPTTVQQPTESPKSPAKLPLFEQVYGQFSKPTLTPSPPPAAQPPVNPQNMTTADGIVSAGMRGAVGGIPTPVLRQAAEDAGKFLSPLTQTAGFFQAADQLDYLLGRKRNQK